MVLTREELLASLQNEVRLFLHLAGKADQSKLDYRPTPKQRSILELVQYLAIMAPTMIVSIKSGDFSREAMMATWGTAEAASKKMTYEQAVAAIEKQSSDFVALFGGWSDADFRSEVEFLGRKFARGHMIVNLVLGGFAAYRTQLFCYLKSTGREELNTMNLWMGMDAPMGPAS
jgi:hypothetical protein